MQPVRLAFHELTFVPEGGDVMVGRPDTDEYALFPADGAHLLQRLVDGVPVQEASAWYEQTYGDPVDIDDFLDTVEGLGFLRHADDPSPEHGETTEALGKRRLARAVFSGPAWVLYAALFLGAMMAMVRDPSVRPWPSNEFYVKSLVVVQLTFISSQIPAVFLHESFHMLAGRRLGLPFRITVGLRLYFFVFETQLKGLLSQPRRARYLPFAAGMVADVIWFSSLTLLATLGISLGGAAGWAGRVALAAAYPTVFRLLWQLYVVLRTDLYYVIATALGCVDLHGATQARLRNIYWKARRRPDRLVDENQWSVRDQHIARWYAPFSFTMTIMLIGLAIGGTLPVLIQVGKLFVEQIHKTNGFDTHFWDLTVGLLLVLTPFLMALAVLVRNYFRRRRTAVAAAVAL